MENINEPTIGNKFNETAQKNLLDDVEQFITKYAMLGKIESIIQTLYDEKIIERDVLIEWHKTKPKSDFSSKISKVIGKILLSDIGSNIKSIFFLIINIIFVIIKIAIKFFCITYFIIAIYSLTHVLLYKAGVIDSL